MSLASRISNLFSGSPAPSRTAENSDDPRLGLGDDGVADSELFSAHSTQKIHKRGARHTDTMAPQNDEEEGRPPYLHAMIAGGIGGTTGDLLMHSLDTVKTRQQGDPHIPSKYPSMSRAYSTILRQEGIRLGLYGGVTPAMLGSFPGTLIFFGTYEWSKRHMIDAGVTPQLAYLTGGFVADFAASFIYVPSEVLKTRLQLQGRYNNPWFKSGYNYRGTVDAARTIIHQEGFSALFYGYKATIFRDLPFSALQFAFYEQGQAWSRQYAGGKDIGLGLELLTGAAAGGLAGVITCPLDVVKTRIQTQVNSPAEPLKSKTPAHPTPPHPAAPHQSAPKHSTTMKGGESPSIKNQIRHISTSSPSTYTPKPGAVNLDTSSVFTGLKLIYKAEGLMGWFRGVGPRFVWTSVQSGTMLFLYQTILKQIEVWSPVDDETVL